MKKLVADTEGAPSAIARTEHAAPRPALSWADGRFLRHGEQHSIRSGSLHYFRVVPEHWADRMTRLVDLGLNTIDTYVPWNFHQRHRDATPDFTRWRDIGRFIETAADAGLDVVLRPGPYICAEWTNGGLPAWATAGRVNPRSMDERFRADVATWFAELLPRLTPYETVEGGPVVAVQVENEFGSFGDDTEYLTWIAALLRENGVREMLYTADGPTDLMLDGGTLPGVLTAATLGSKPDQARAMLAARRPREPFFVAEFWNGWFDHWGHPHHVRDADNAARTVAEALRDGGSISLYMAHGGSNFGLWSGANMVEGELRPTTTSYDSDAPIAEDGRLTEKFHALRDVFGVADRPITAPPIRYLAPRRLDVTAGPSLVSVLDGLAASSDGIRPAPPTFEDLGLDAGLVVYDADVLLPGGPVDLVFSEVADRAIVLLDGVDVGTVTARGSVRVDGAGPRRLTVVVENLGRVNYGPSLGAAKGLLGPVLVDRRMVQGWTARPVALDEVEATRFDAVQGAAGGDGDGSTAGLLRAVLEIDEPLDTHLTLPGFTKGFVWVNGRLLGRYWNVGPQSTLYLPGPFLGPGSNTIDVLELHQAGSGLELLDHAELGPSEQYIEEF